MISEITQFYYNILQAMSETNKQSARDQREPAAIIKNTKKLYIYAEVDIDKAYAEIISKSKKIQKYLESNKLDFQFQEKIRNYKNFRICFDSEIQKFIHTKELNPDLRLIKKNVFSTLEDFIIERYRIYIEDQQMHEQYKAKVQEVELKFMKRMEELMRNIED